MKEVFGLKIGGLQHKIIQLVLIFLLATVCVFAISSLVGSRSLKETVETARVEQENAIANITSSTMQDVLQNSMVKTTEMSAKIADDNFAQISEYIQMMQRMAVDLFSHPEELEPLPVGPPDPSLEGTTAYYCLCEEGVDYTQSEYLPIAAHMGETMISLYDTSPKIGGFYMGLADGTHFGINNKFSNKYDEDGNLIPFPVRQRPWYVGAVKKGGLYFTGLEEDAFNGEYYITCSAPVYVGGKLIGVIGIDFSALNAEEVGDYTEGNAEEGFGCIINERGQVILGPKDNGIFEIKPSDEAEDLRNSQNHALAGFVRSALSGKTGLTSLVIDNKEYYVTGAPMETVGWAAISVVSKERVEQPASYMLESFDSINHGATEVFEENLAHRSLVTRLLIFAILVLGVGVAFWQSRAIVRPVESMTQEIMIGASTGKLFEMKPLYRTSDEIETLALAFDDLSKKTKAYIEQLTVITKEKERISTELELARKIQADMLPNIFPPFPERKEFDIYASMTPAKEVGGDFYDFFLIDDDHLGVVMADVSGKGVPAALFMMMSKMLINNFAMLGSSPAKVLEMANAVICQNNEEEMFVTTWFGVYEISTGKLTAASAGHEYPIIRKAGGDFEVYKDIHGFVLGGMEGLKYKEYELHFEKGDMLFLYTDGLPEATNAAEDMYELDRAVKALNDNKDRSLRELLDAVKADVDAFVGDADQFDDLTMLVLKIE